MRTTHVGEHLGRSRQVSLWLIRAAIPLGLVLSIGITIAAQQAHDRAEQLAEAERWADELHTLVGDLDDHSDDIWTRESLTGEARAEGQRMRLEVHELIAELQASGLAARQLPAIRSELARYEDVTDAHLAWVAGHDPSEDEGEEHFDATVDPAHKELSGSDKRLLADLSQRALSAERLADRLIFALLPITILSVMLVLAFRRAEGLRHKVAVRDLEARHNARFRSLVRNASDLICVTDEAGRCSFATPSATTLLGVAPDELTGRSLSGFADAAAIAAAIAAAKLGSPAEVALQARHADGQTRRLEGRCLDLSHDASVGGFVWNLRDETAQHELETRLTHQAHHDALTGLANRVLFRERAEQALSASRHGGNPVALMLLDVDNFKTINDSFGHEAGDSVLTTIADRCRTCVRSGDTVARLGGDEFAILLDDADSDTAREIAQRLCELMERPHRTQGSEVRATVSIGVAVGGPTASNVDELLRFADAAMYAAKSAGRARYRIFDAEHAEENVS
jgi:diguanylate cyclase (GGDEF)-like protein/PAS domain S-box-containing protein